MAEKLIARQTFDGLWQWRSATADGDWVSDVYHTGDDEALAEQARTHSAAVTLLMQGESVVSTTAEIEAKDKRHLAKLLPFELEEQIIDDVEDVHLAFGPIRNEKVSVIYSKNDSVAAAIEPLLALSCDLRSVVPDYFSLRTENQGVTVVVDSGQLVVRKGESDGLILFGNSSTPASAARIVSVHDARDYIGKRMKLPSAVSGGIDVKENEFLFDDDAPNVGSAALAVLQHGSPLGLLAIGNQDPTYYRSSMGTLFLGYIAEVLNRLLPQYLK